ncbi:MAG: hypothetical protein IPJ19_13845 [Planctomycetes bacterium]|nr:hypothetical protein [Planctomycetota bacterium]
MEPAPAPAAKPPWDAAWSRAEATQRTNQLNKALGEGTASLSDVLDFATQALEGLDTADAQPGADGSVALTLKASDGFALGTLRVMPASAAGIRSMQLSIDGEAQGEIVRFADSGAKSTSNLQVALGFGTTAPEYGVAISQAEFSQSRAFKQRIMDMDPLRVGGSLRVDKQGAASWQGFEIRAYMDKTSNEPSLESKMTSAESRGSASLSDPRFSKLQQVLESVGKH